MLMTWISIVSRLAYISCDLLNIYYLCNKKIIINRTNNTKV
uniref:Uncharacterized protein n=1 Tax=Arundo donax TaxID=35708 RepID=A0A0A9GSU1_ARUDO